MKEKQVTPSQIGSYQIIKRIGKGGMGEVYLAHDPICERSVALKCIRTDRKKIKGIKERFLHEATITSQLAHPSIIPVYTIASQEDTIYYTMPYIEGETLKQVLRRTRRLEKEGKEADPIGGSIPSLTRIFLQVCEALAYAHSQKVLHRDIKPENIILGKYGEVLILDWGLAKAIEDSTNASADHHQTSSKKQTPSSHHTMIGKALGTLSYMAPERAFASSATISTEIYALGVILYQILTLHFPFSRKSIKDFRKNFEKEKYIDPSSIAPYRDIPKMLSHIAKECLQKSPEGRYPSVDALIRSLKSYIEGRSEWFFIKTLNINLKDHWEFQENILLAEHVAITGITEIAEWVGMMVSKQSFTGNTKIHAKIRIKKGCSGIGFLLGVPEASEPAHPSLGYFLWIGSKHGPSTKLIRSTVEVMPIPDIKLSCDQWHTITIEKIDHTIFFTLDNSQTFSYVSFLPFEGSRVGLLYRDNNFEIEGLKIFMGSLHVTVSCLAVPDAFLANKNFNKALSEYRNIGNSFPGRDEGRVAMFRAGITLIEQAHSHECPDKKNATFQLAWEEFEKLHATPGAPLEYLGKSLVHNALEDNEEEVKCLELACRKYRNHPLLSLIQEQIVYRTHYSSRHCRLGAYRFLLLVFQHLPHIVKNNDTQKLFISLQKHWEPLYFIIPFPQEEAITSVKHTQFSAILAFWLAKPYVLQEILDNLEKEGLSSPTLIGNLLFSLLEIEAFQLAKEKFLEFHSKVENSNDPMATTLSNLRPIIFCHSKGLKESVEALLSLEKTHFNKELERSYLYLMNFSLHKREFHCLHLIYDDLKKFPLSDECKIQSDGYKIWALLLESKWDFVSPLFEKYPLEFIKQETNLLHFLYVCWLHIKENKTLNSISQSRIFETPFPRTHSLAIHYLFSKTNNKKTWLKRTFPWEKKHLYHQLSLFYHCLGNHEKKEFYKNRGKQVFKSN